MKSTVMKNTAVKNKECNHSKTSKEKQVKEFQGEKFHYDALTCKDCGASIWNNELEKKYGIWLEKLYVKKRHLFQVQYFLAEEAISCIHKLSERFPRVDESLFIRAMVIVYLSIVHDNEKVIKMLSSYAENPLLTIGKKKAKKLQFRPDGIRSIFASADMLKIKPNKIVEEAIYRILIVSANETQEMKELWEKVILKNIEMILKAA